MKKLQLAIVPIVLAVSMSSHAQSSDDWQSWPTASRFNVGAGYFSPDLSTSILITDADGIFGTGISFEQNLGLDDNKGTGLLYIGWRFAKKHSLEFRYFELNRSGAGTSSVSVGIGGLIFDIDLPIQSYFDISANELAYSYSLLLDEKKELFVGLGVSIQDLSLGIQGTASSPIPGEIINSTLESTAPLPTLNIGFNYAFNDKWLFISRFGWLAVELDFGADEDFSGQIVNANAGVQWNAFKNVGFYAHYQVFDLDVDYLVDGVRFAIDYDYTGPVLGVEVRF